MDTAHNPHANALPANLGAPAFVDAWKMRALIVGVVFAVIAVILAYLDQSQYGLGWDHLWRAWTLGTMWTWGLCIGGLAMLMVQYCSGGKWGLLLRRPFEALSRTLPLIFVYWLVLALNIKRLYLWAVYTTKEATESALKSGADLRNSGALPQLQAADVEPGYVLGRESALFRFVGLLLDSAERAGDEARGRQP